MTKKRKTKQEKIISRLRRQVAVSPIVEHFSIKGEPAKKTINTVFSYNPRLIKRDLLKTLALSLIIVIFELVLYSRLK